MAQSKEEISQELRQVLIDFWLGCMQSTDADFPERMRASELLAKYILGEGPTPIKRQDRRSSMAEILRLTDEIEQAGGMS